MAIEKEIKVNVNLSDAQKQLEYINGELEDAKQLTDDWEKELFELEKQLKNTPKNSLAQQKKLRDEITKQKDLIKEQKFAVKDLSKSQKKANEVVKNAAKGQADYSAATGLADRATGGLVSSFKSMKTGIAGAVKGLFTLRGAIMATGIGALVVLVVSLMQAFKRSEEGQNKFAKLTAIIGAVVGQLADGLATLGEKIIEAVQNPQKAWDDFTTALQKGYQFVKQQVIDRFSGTWGILVGKISKGILKLRIAWNDWTGDSTEANQLREELKEVNKSIEESRKKIENANKAVADVYKDAKESVTEFIKETEREAQIAGKIADTRAKADKLERKLLVDRAKATRDMNDLREKAEDREKFSVQERIKFLQDASKIDEEITQKEIDRVAMLLKAKRDENALGKSTKEDKMEEARLSAELINLESQQLRKKKALTAREIALKREAAAEEKAEEQALAEFKKQVREAEANTIEENRALQLEKEKERFDALIEQAIEQGLSTEELERSQRESLKAMRDGFLAEDEASRIKQVEEVKKAEKEKLDAQIEAIEAEEANRQRQIGVAQGAINGLKAIFSAFGNENRELAIAGIVADQVSGISRIISNTAVANAKSVAASPLTAGMPWVAINNVMAGVSIAGSVAGAAKSIAELKSKKKTPSTASAPSGGGRAGGMSGSSAPSQAPAFNIVGQSGTDQLAEAIGGQQSQPVQAYVVSNDVTSAQSMDRNIVESASI